MAPRFQLSGYQDLVQFSNADGKKLAKDGAMCLKFIDTEKEKQIGLGTTWPFKKLNPHECIISNKFKKSEGVNIGESVKINLKMRNFWYTHYHYYNEIASERGWP